MSQTVAKDSKEQIMIAFGKLLNQYGEDESQVATKEAELEKAKNQQLLAKASEYTVNNIVNGMASLQLDFSSAINELSQKVATEASKLEELKKALAIETENLKQLRKVRLVADTLYILEQEHQEQLKNLENRTALEQEALEKEIAQSRRDWQREQQEFEGKIVEEAELIAKQREKEALDFQYTVARERQIERDEYEEKKRQQARNLAATDREKQKNWVEREQYLAEHRAKFEANQKRIAGFEDELKQEYNRVKGEAIREAERETKVKADLFEKEWQATQQGYQFKVESLEATIERQTEQIAELTAQLQAATTQAQNLAMRAFQNTAN